MTSGKTIELQTPGGISFSAYVAGSDDARGAVLLIHEWWGLQDHNRAWADRFAEEGYRVLAVDLYDGRVTDDPEEAGRWMRGIEQGRADAKLRAALGYLEAPGRQIATYGCSFGGRQSLQAALLAPAAVSATVMAYSRMETDVELLKTLQGPVLGIYAEQERNWPDKQQDFEQAMAEAGRVTESVSYDAAHGFTNPSSPRFDPEAEAHAWDVTLDFLRRHL